MQVTHGFSSTPVNDEVNVWNFNTRSNVKSAYDKTFNVVWP